MNNTIQITILCSVIYVQTEMASKISYLNPNEYNTYVHLEPTSAQIS